MNLLEKQAQPAEQMPPEDDEPVDMSDGDPAYQQAKEMLLTKLYEEGMAEEIAQAMAAAPDPVQGVVDQTMALLDVMEQTTQGAVPDELVMSFVLEVTQEMVDIAQGAKLPIGNKEVAIITREVMAGVMDTLGVDTTGVREEMASVDPEQVAQVMGG
jgi:hypothetical protein